MSKVATIILATGGIAAASVGGYYLMFEKKSKLEFESLDDFKNHANDNSTCVKDYFSGVNYKGEGVADISSGSPADESFFKSQESPETPYKSCLLINWRKTEYKENESTTKWTGKFSWLWTFVKGDEGFVTFSIVTPSSEEGKADFSGVFYLLGKKDGEDVWEIKHKKEAKEKKGSSDLDSYFPKAGTDFDGTKKPYWEWIDNSNKLDSLCMEENCKGVRGMTSYKTIKKVWTGSKNTETANKKLKDWSSDFNWWKKIFGLESTWNLENKIDGFSGTWTKLDADS